jgi:hypothetical protein
MSRNRITKAHLPKQDDQGGGDDQASDATAKHKATKFIMESRAFRPIHSYHVAA